MKFFLPILFILFSGTADSQLPDYVYSNRIRTPQLYGYGDQLSYPVIRLNSNDRLELSFDDLDGDVKSYYYTFQLCNADWTPAQVSQFDYVRGFPQLLISAYRFSSIALTKYTHYQAIIPDINSAPTVPGNFLVKVFLDADTSKLAFTRRFLVLGTGVQIGAQVLQPFNPQTTNTNQKLQFVVNTGNFSILDPSQQLKVVVLQNHRWDIAVSKFKPSIYTGSRFEYNNDDDYSFPAGKPWRWLDIQSFRFQSDRVQRAEYSKTATTILVKPDPERSRMPYYFYNDINGYYYVQTTESVNPYWQTDYATVRFSYVPEGNIPYPDKDVYLIGKMNDYALSDETKMTFNAERGMYELSTFLKQGYYNYSYVTVDRGDPDKRPSFQLTEGNFKDTENDYTILVYYRPLGGRADQLVGMATLNSMPTN
jgi:hypothetical protein